jgi:hypothetical protein
MHQVAAAIARVGGGGREVCHGHVSQPLLMLHLAYMHTPHIAYQPHDDKMITLCVLAGLIWRVTSAFSATNEQDK